MKTYSLFLCLIIYFLTGCSTSKKEYVIEGTLPSAQYDGEWIYLVPMTDPFGRVDSVQITNASFRFRGKGEEMRVLRLRPILRLRIQELLVITEPGLIKVKADSIGSVTGTPQNDALQMWKVNLETATNSDSLRLAQKQETNFRLLLTHKNNTLGKFMQPRIYGTLSDEQKKKLDES